MKNYRYLLKEIIINIFKVIEKVEILGVEYEKLIVECYLYCISKVILFKI